MKDENYIVVPGWAINKLKLEGTDLLVFSIIHGFSQDGINKYTGSIRYLQEATGKSKSTIIRSLSSLVESMFLEKTSLEINGVKYAHYKACQNDTSGVKMKQPQCQNETGGGVKMKPYNLFTDILIDIQENRNKKSEMLNDSKTLISDFQESLHLSEIDLISKIIDFKKECDLTRIEPKQDHLYRWIKKQKSLPPTKQINKLKQEVDWSKV